MSAAPLAYGVSTGRNGRKYPYFFCVGRVNGHAAPATNIRPELIEHAIQRYYVERPVQLSAEDVQARTEAIEALVGVSQEALTRVEQAKTQLIRSLEARQDALLDMRFGEKSISPALFKRRQETLQTELDAAHESLAESKQRLNIEAEQLRMALRAGRERGPGLRRRQRPDQARLQPGVFQRALPYCPSGTRPRARPSCGSSAPS